jgi:hypothetical protein
MGDVYSLLGSKPGMISWRISSSKDFSVGMRSGFAELETAENAFLGHSLLGISPQNQCGYVIIYGNSCNRNHLDSTGKGACACARHGTFVPHCMFDLQKGER